MDWTAFFSSLYNKIFAWACYLITEIGSVFGVAYARGNVPSFNRANLFIFQHWKSNPLIDWNKSQRTAKEYLTIKRQTCSARYIIPLHCTALHYITIQWRAKFHVNVIRQCGIFFFIHFFLQLSYQFFHYFLANFILFSILNVHCSFCLRNGNTFIRSCHFVATLYVSIQ